MGDKLDKTAQTVGKAGDELKIHGSSGARCDRAYSFLNTQKKLCKKMDVASDSDRTMTSLVESGVDFILSSLISSKQLETSSMPSSPGARNTERS